MADRPAHTDGEIEALASAIFDALSMDHPTAFIQGDPLSEEPVTIDGRFDLKNVAGLALASINRGNSTRSFWPWHWIGALLRGSLRKSRSLRTAADYRFPGLVHTK